MSAVPNHDWDTVSIDADSFGSRQQEARDEPMPNTSAHQIFKKRGMQTIATEQPTGALIPFDFNGVVFRQMFEYAVVEFKTEVGFFSEVFGFNAIAMGPDYALFTTPTSDFHFSIRRADEQHAAGNLQGIKLLFMTADFASAEARIRESGLVDDAAVGKGSPSQRVVSLASPAGLPIEIWEDPFPQREA